MAERDFYPIIEFPDAQPETEEVSSPNELLAIASVLPLPADAGDRWVQGVSWMQEGCGIYADSFDVGCPPPSTASLFTSDHFGDTLTQVYQRGFGLASAWACSALSFQDDFVGQVTLDNLDDFTEYLLGRTLAAGITGQAGLHCLASEAIPIAGTWDRASAIGQLEEARGGVRGDDTTVIHCSRAVFNLLATNNSLRFNGEHYVTPSGSLVIASNAYTPSVLIPTGQAAANGHEWMFATGNVYYRVSDSSLIGTQEQATSIAKDVIERIATMYALLVFEQCSVYAIKVDVPTPS